MHAGCQFSDLGLPPYSSSSDLVNATAVRIDGNSTVTFDGCEINSPPPDPELINFRNLPPQFSPTRSVASISLGESGIARIVDTDFERSCEV